MSLVEHAEFELRRAGLFSPDSDYNGMLGSAILKMVREFASEGHSGMSAHLCLDIFNRVARWKPLSPITDDPAEWIEVGHGHWQNRRLSSAFSNDGGETYYDIDERRSWWRKKLRLGHHGFRIRRSKEATI